MPVSLPYLAAPGSLKTALEKIKTAATPDRVTGDFVTTKLQIKGGTGRALPPFFKKIGFVNSDGSPSELYKKFRNGSFSGAAIAEAIKEGYRELSEVNEYFYELSDKDLLGLIVQVTGAEPNGSVAKLTLSTLNSLRSLADFDTVAPEEPSPQIARETISLPQAAPPQGKKVGMNLSYTINLNLPATTDQAVFNAIFKSLKEHLLSYDHE